MNTLDLQQRLQKSDCKGVEVSTGFDSSRYFYKKEILDIRWEDNYLIIELVSGSTHFIQSPVVIVFSVEDQLPF